MGKIIAKLAANVAFVRAAAVTAAIVLPGLLSLGLQWVDPGALHVRGDAHDRSGLLRCGAAESGRRALHPNRQAGRRARARLSRCGRVGEVGAGRGPQLDGGADPRAARGRGRLHGLGRRAGAVKMGLLASIAGTAWHLVGGHLLGGGVGKAEGITFAIGGQILRRRDPGLLCPERAVPAGSRHLHRGNRRRARERSVRCSQGRIPRADLTVLGGHHEEADTVELPEG